MFGRRIASCALAGALLIAAHLPAQTVYPTGTTIWDPVRTYDGLTIFATLQGTIVAIDMDGTVVNEWVSPLPNLLLSDVQPLEDGRILGYAGLSNRVRHTVGELDYDGNLVWSYSLPAGLPITTTFHHDLDRAPNGNTFLLGYHNVDAPAISPKTLRDDFILEVDPAGNVVWSWETWQHFAEFGFRPDQANLISDQGADWAHTNTVSVIPANRHTAPEFAEGNLIVSQRYTNTIFIIDKASGQVVWKVGPDDDHLTWGQHTTYMIGEGVPGEGNILVFDNGSATGYAPQRRGPGRSRVLEIDPVTKQVVWSYSEGRNFHSDVVSGAQRLPNGNTLICSGVRGRVFEVRQSGEIVWEYMSPYSQKNGLGITSQVYRAYRVPYDWVP